MARRFTPGKKRKSLGSPSAEALESRTLLAFGLTMTSSLYTIDTGAGLVFSVQYTASQGSVGDLTSAKLNGTELEAPFATSSRYSHYESGLGSGTVVTPTTDPNGQWILITCDDSAGTGVIQYYLGRKGFNNIYMATYAPGPNSPSPGEMRFIDYTNPTLLTTIPAPSNNNGNTGAIESSDVFGHADGTTTSKYYGEYRAIDTQTYGVSGGGFGFWMNIGNRETSSGGPFYKDIDFQNNELYTYTFSGHSQTENFRPGLKGFYALMATTTTTAPAAPDYTFIDTLGVGQYISGYTGAAGRGTLSGTASGVPSGLQATVAISNAADQYWALPDPVTGAYTITGVLPGTYTETLYQNELAIGNVPVTITAGATTKQNITNTLSYTEESSSSTTITTPVVSNPIFRIGTWDGTPIGFLNADKIQNMHPTDVRMSPWAADSSGLTNFTVGTSPDSAWPMAEWHAQTAAAPFVDTDNRITFTLTAAQVATALTLRVGLTRLDSERPNLSVNGHSTSTQSIASQPSSRGLTTGNWRGNNVVYIFNLSTSWMIAGTNTIDIFSVSGSAGTLYSGYHIYDAIDLVPTSTLTNASVVTTVSVSPTPTQVAPNATKQFTATAKDQFGNTMPANFVWSDTSGTVDGTGFYTAGSSFGTDTVTATSGTKSGNASVNVVISEIDGTSGNDTIRLVRSGSNLLVYVNNPNTPVYTIPFSLLGALTVNGQGGSDNINIDFSGGASPVPSAGLTVDGGTGGGGTGQANLTVTGTTGNDTASVNATTVTFNSSPITYAHTVSIAIVGNGGTDSLTQTAQPGNSAKLGFADTAGGTTSATDSLTVSAGTYQFAATAAGSGVVPMPLASLSIGSGASVAVASAASTSDRYVMDLGSLTLPGTINNGWTGKLDLGWNDLVVMNGNFATLNSQLKFGLNASGGGYWNGNGIISSVAAADASKTKTIGIILNNIPLYGATAPRGPFDGLNVGTADVLIKPTIVGDAELSGSVNAADYSFTDNGYSMKLTGWINGDFNYDGTVNPADYSLIDNGFAFSGALPAAPLAASVKTDAIAPQPATLPIQRPDIVQAVVVIPSNVFASDETDSPDVLS
jgi:rhamnogalacturonan endolyase